MVYKGQSGRFTIQEWRKRRFQLSIILLLIKLIINNTLKGNLALTQSIAMNSSENTASNRSNPSIRRW